MSASSDMKPALETLRAAISRLEGVLPFGVREIDSRLPGGGLALGALHEVAGGGNGLATVLCRLTERFKLTSGEARNHGSDAHRRIPP